MGGVSTVDVREMLCAQALALVARAVTPLEAGAQVRIRYSTEDVKHDLLVWAKSRGYVVHDEDEMLRLSVPRHP